MSGKHASAETEVPRRPLAELAVDELAVRGAVRCYRRRANDESEEETQIKRALKKQMVARTRQYAVAVQW